MNPEYYAAALAAAAEFAGKAADALDLLEAELRELYGFDIHEAKYDLHSALGEGFKARRHDC